ncbi:unnamed protein product [Adineta ricciae]|uniref:NADP-dependent oxidoreductase domain-containing protein n=1 Tax=Adineta ricciae TaxID=249248 RepID=A0A815GUA5_ADIRI|nr:unnamed protein product [Adineta ricciae]CAF1343413.1 unnamed protein product [Adineta ricciae]
MMSKVKRVFGTATFNKNGPGFKTKEELSKVLSFLKADGIDELDTARRYGDGTSEELLGETPDFEGFSVATKASPYVNKLTKENTITQCETSLKVLKRSSVDIFYIHVPDRSTPFEETAEAIHELYQRGCFKRFGLSNLTAEEVQRMYDICKQNNYVLPSVYQGNYNLMTRKNEQELFPLLRKLGMKFYAYSPLAGGFLIKTPDQIKNAQVNSRFDVSTRYGQLYSSLYCKDSLFLALEKFQNSCKESNIKPSEVCFSWLLNHSALEEGDAIILGASNMQQLQENLSDSKAAPLNVDMIQILNDLWNIVKDEAPAYHV